MTWSVYLGLVYDNPEGIEITGEFMCGDITLYKGCVFDFLTVTSTVFESKDDPTQMTKAVIYNYILYYIQKTIHSKHICKNVHS